MQSFKFRNGMAVPIPAPATVLEDQEREVSSVALYGDDFLGPRWKPVVKEGQHVACGEPVLCDRHNQQLVVVSPCQGAIQTVELGARRKVERVLINVDTAAENSFQCHLEPHGADENPTTLKNYLLATGLWTSLQTRPFGFVPAIGETPSNIFVNACQKTGNSPDPVGMDAAEWQYFKCGVEALATLVERQVFICQNAPQPLYHGGNTNIGNIRFSGAYSAQLSSTHVHALNNGQAMAWAVGWQDVLVLGQALETGFVSWTRRTNVAGNAAKVRICVDAPIGASLRDLAAGLAQKPADKVPMSVLSGDVIGGMPASHLHRFDDCVSLQRGRTAFSGVGSGETISPLTPRNALLNALPFGEPSLPLMRALMSGDLERARILGAEKMVEEDVAQLTRLCASGADYGKMLRAALDSYDGGGR